MLIIKSLITKRSKDLISKLEKNNHKKSDEAKKKTTQNTIQEINVLLIGDSMVKNSDYKKLERAAREKTVCHSYSGAKVGQIKEKIDEYWSENHQYDCTSK
jgi:hypothetical protein